MTEETVSQGEARLFYQLRENQELQNLLEKVEEFTYSLEDLYDEEIREEDDAMIVFLRVQEDDATHYIARGVFEENENGEFVVEDVRIEKSTVYGPLAGRGTRWFYEGGELVERQWIS